MGYRGYKYWREFVNQNKELFYKTSLPIDYIEYQGDFDYFLMHGCTHDSNYMDYKNGVPESERKIIRELIFKYFEFGFPDPGVVAMKGVITNDEIDKIRKAIKN